MATAAFETPKLKPYPVIPLVQAGAMAHSKPYVASATIQKNIGFPGERGGEDDFRRALRGQRGVGGIRHGVILCRRHLEAGGDDDRQLSGASAIE